MPSSVVRTILVTQTCKRMVKLLNYKEFSEEAAALHLALVLSTVNCGAGVRWQIFGRRPAKGWGQACEPGMIAKLPAGTCSTFAMLIPKCGSTSIRQILRYWR